MEHKSTLQEIEARFDQDVERFSNLETGQATTLDAAFNMNLITDAIRACYPQLTDVMDIGCGAGNYMVRLLQKVPGLNVTLVDLSQPMLTRAQQRVQALTTGTVTTKKGDFRTLDFGNKPVQAIVATAVLHHLRENADWEAAFARLYDLLQPGGSLWVFDLVQQQDSRLQELIYRERYGDYLTALKDEAYRDHVFAYIEQEDSPRNLIYQLQLMEKVGFRQMDILHKSLCFASYVGFK